MLCLGKSIAKFWANQENYHVSVLNGRFYFEASIIQPDYFYKSSAHVTVNVFRALQKLRCNFWLCQSCNGHLSQPLSGLSRNACVNGNVA